MMQIVLHICTKKSHYLQQSCYLQKSSRGILSQRWEQMHHPHPEVTEWNVLQRRGNVDIGEALLPMLPDPRREVVDFLKATASGSSIKVCTLMFAISATHYLETTSLNCKYSLQYDNNDTIIINFQFSYYHKFSIFIVLLKWLRAQPFEHTVKSQEIRNTTIKSRELSVNVGAVRCICSACLGIIPLQITAAFQHALSHVGRLRLPSEVRPSQSVVFQGHILGQYA
jgi:hypothetical protein